MEWEQGRRSQNIEDRRGQSGGGGFPGGGGRRMPVRAGGGLGLLVILGIVFLLTGGDLRAVLGVLGATQGGAIAPPAVEDTGPPTGVEQGASRSTAEAQMADMVSVVLADTEDYWTGYFRDQLRRDYPQPTLVLFTGSTRSPCGTASGATGPFYCPADKKVYLDLAFFDDMATKLGARGDFAAAYVIAHEVGHHVQEELGILAQTRRGDRQGAESEAVRAELQADCFAGAWAKNAARLGNIRLEPGDVEEALGAAAAVGDDRLQKAAQGYAVPDSFTHGTSEQRAKWFSIGYHTGDPAQCDTFRAQAL